MPRYDYQCQKCQYEFELSLSLKERDEDSPKKVCPQCMSHDIRQLIVLGSGGILRSGQGPACQSSSSCSPRSCCAGSSGCPHTK